MHAILIAIGSAGDVFPFIGLARTLKLRGHRVSLCTIPVFRDAVEQHGIAFVPLSDELTYRRTMGDPRLWDPKTSFGVLWQAIAGMIEPVYEYVSAQRHDDIVVVGSLWALGARIAHEKYGIPYLSAQVSPSTLLSAHLPPVHPKFNVPEQMPLAMRKLLWRCIERFKLDRTCAPEINAVRRKVGLETPVKRIFTQWMHSPQGVVCLFPAWFAPPQQDWPQPLHMTGFPLFDGSIPGTPLDDELQRFLDQGSRPLVFTQGSTEHLQGDFYAMALRALERLGARGIFLTGAGQEPLRGLPNHVLQRAYAPLGALLPSCAGLVHPGGIGAMSLALAAGCRRCCCPAPTTSSTMPNGWSGSAAGCAWACHCASRSCAGRCGACSRNRPWRRPVGVSWNCHNRTVSLAVKRPRWSNVVIGRGCAMAEGCVLNGAGITDRVAMILPYRQGCALDSVIPRANSAVMHFIDQGLLQ